MGACVVGFQACFLAASVLVDKIERDVSVQSTLMYPIVPRVRYSTSTTEYPNVPYSPLEYAIVLVPQSTLMYPIVP